MVAVQLHLRILQDLKMMNTLLRLLVEQVLILILQILLLYMRTIQQINEVIMLHLKIGTKAF